MGAQHSETQFLSLTAAGVGGQTTAADYARALAQGVEWLRFEPAIERNIAARTSCACVPGALLAARSSSRSA